MRSCKIFNLFVELIQKNRQYGNFIWKVLIDSWL